MPRVNFVKKANKDNPVCKKGESYYWWKFRFGGKRYSLTPPRQSQLTQSEFLSEVYSIQEEMEDASPDDVEELQSLVEDWMDRIEEQAEMCREKFDNMPEGLQQGDTGMMLEERAEAMDNWHMELEGIDLEYNEDDFGPKTEDNVAEFIQERLEEISNADPGV